MLCSVYTTIAGEYCDPGFWTPIGKIRKKIDKTISKKSHTWIIYTWMGN